MQWLIKLSTFDSDRISNELSKHSELVFLFPHSEKKSRDLTKEVLSKITKTPLQKVELEKNENGKPFWPDSPWRFNASDSSNWMLLGFSNKRSVGVDIERERELRHTGKFPERIMTEFEQKDFDLVPHELHLKRLIQSWSLKEAVLKCHGGSFFRDAHRIGLKFDPLKISELPEEFGPIPEWQVDQTSVIDRDGTHFTVSRAYR